MAMFRTVLHVFAFVALAGGTLAGCQHVGPTAIEEGRDRYNSIIHSTSMEQTLSNIVRVFRHEPTLIMDVTEVDAALSIGGALNGAAADIGAKPGTSGGTLSGSVGSAGGMLQYSETPTIRYVPLLGQAAVQQLVTPVSVDVLAALTDSYWNPAAVLNFAASYITLDYDEWYSALNLIIELDTKTYVEFVAAKSELTPETNESSPVRTPNARGGAIIVNNTPSTTAKATNSLNIYLRPFHPHEENAKYVNDERRYLQLWVRLLRIYAGTQPAYHPGASCPAEDKAVWRQTPKDLQRYLQNIDTNIRTMTYTAVVKKVDCLPHVIELRTVPVPSNYKDRTQVTLISHAPVMKTESAIGILKSAVEGPGPLIEFMTPEAYQSVVSRQWNKDVINKTTTNRRDLVQNIDSLPYYTLLQKEEDSICPLERIKTDGCDNPDEKELAPTLDSWIEQWVDQPQRPGELFTYEIGSDSLNNYYVKMNRALAHRRRYVLIVVDEHLPEKTPYVAYFDKGKWFYINGDDQISQKNFTLISLFGTMMAAPPQTPPLTPTISVGG